MLKNLRSFGTGVARVCELAMMPAKSNFPHSTAAGKSRRIASRPDDELLQFPRQIV